jgi:hypothetical protein
MIVKEKDPNKKATQDDSVLKRQTKNYQKPKKAKAKFDKIEAKREKKEKQKEIYKDLKDGYKEFESKDSRTKRAKSSTS